MGFRLALLGAALLVVTSPAFAQEDIGSQEIVVTGSRIDADDYSDRVPAVGLKRVADFAIRRVRVTGDTRDSNARHEEMYQTIARAIEVAKTYGVQLAYGETIVEPLSAANYRDLTFSPAGRPDTNQVGLLVKAPLGGNADARDATARIDRFIKAIKPVGRALVEENGSLTLSIVAPDQYRDEIGAIIAKDATAMAARFGAIIAKDATAMAARFGTDYAVEVRGLTRPVEWARAGLTEVLLYIPYELVIVPKP